MADVKWQLVCKRFTAATRLSLKQAKFKLKRLIVLHLTKKQVRTNTPKIHLALPKYSK